MVRVKKSDAGKLKIEKNVKKGDVGGVDNSFGVAGVVFGVLSILSLGFGGIVLGVIGLIFSNKQKKFSGNSWSRAGWILNVLGIVLSILVIILMIYFFPEYLNQFNLGSGA